MIKRRRAGWSRARWKVLAIALLLTAVTIYLAYDLSDGEFETRRYGLLTPAATPIRFAVMVLAEIGFLALTGLYWLFVWFGPEEPQVRIRAEFDDPSKRSQL